MLTFPTESRQYLRRPARGQLYLVWSQAFLAPLRVEFTLLVDEVQVAGDWAFERGMYTINLIPKAGGEPVQDIGKYITVYERQPGGAWGMARDIWNSNNPPSIRR